MSRVLARVMAALFRLAVRFADAAIKRWAPGGRDVFFDPAGFPWTVELEANWLDIRHELDGVLVNRASIPNFQDVSEEQRVITDDDRWKTYVFFVFGTPIERNCEHCPKTAALLRRIPGLCNAMFSILAPGKHIPAHLGPYNGLLRYHLALKVPVDSDSCSIWVAGQRRQWREGKTLVFDDTWEHSVQNDTEQERVVLFADFERPLPRPLAWLNKVLLTLLASTPLARDPIDRFEQGLL